MNRLALFTAAFAMSIVFFASCSQSELNTISISEATSIIPGNYKVNNYDNGSGNTTAYDNYTFEFQSNGTLIASNGMDAYNGQWTIQTENAVDYDKSVTITITGNADLDALNHTWFVEELSDVTLYLTDDDTEILQLIKN